MPLEIILRTFVLQENEGKLPFPPSSLLIPDGVSSEERDASASEVYQFS